MSVYSSTPARATEEDSVWGGEKKELNGTTEPGSSFIGLFLFSCMIFG